MRHILGWLFGCSHSRTTFPLTLVRGRAPHVTCLSCGKEFDYNWEEMRVGRAIKPVAPAMRVGVSHAE